MWEDTRYPILFASGVFSHITYFARGEHHLSGALYVQIFGLAFAALTLVSHGGGSSIRDGFTQAFGVMFSYLVGVFFSLAIYRLFLHPLRTFPGPTWARLSGLWLAWRARRRDAFRQVKSMHDQYGPIVRVGPTDLSIAHPSAVDIVHGFGTQCTKGPWYDVYRPMVSLHIYRSKVEHDQRRRVWSAAFGDRALRGYELRLHKYRKQLLDQIVARHGQPMSVTKWFYSYSFDVLGDLAFGKSFNMLETGREHWAVTMINEGVQALGFNLPTWLFRLLVNVPGLARGWRRLFDFAEQQMQEQIKAEVEFQTIGSALAAPLKGREPRQADLDLLRGDGQLIVVAGSETTAVVLSLVIYELARRPGQLEKLRQEIAPYVSDPGEEILNSDIQHLEHLNAVIMEVLRLYPPVPTQMQRKTPPDGIAVEGVHIPGNTLIWTPLYTIGRSES
ncbi:cytochrome P450 [Aspergillus melleus]|uniref:cytochrome P450 n=1 Tax=Aspergillus melleus TaxID=138277 RepID=UPI001E8E5E6C|nr:uncharacterized protein LDX57_012057 [Aspergillus melleus]KAH8434410.1 hypothetical protein LDX57_012057 [Aspergillus melleus]